MIKSKLIISIVKPFLLLLLLSALVMIGCMSPNPLQPQVMIPVDINGNYQHNYSVSIDVYGGYNPQCFDYCLTTDAFTEALRSSITTSGVFSKIVSPQETDYLLDIVIVKKYVNTTLITQWELRDAKTNAILWAEIIKTYIASNASYKFNQRENEAVVRENIKTGIEKMMALTL